MKCRWPTAALVLVAACHVAPGTRELPIEHPANPLAPAIEFAPPPDPFEITTSYAPPRPSTAATHGRRATMMSGSEEAAEARGRAGAPTPTSYACPMHPDVVRPEPGTCPVCGMQLQAVQDHPHQASER